MEKKSTLIIAEAGVNHNGDVELAKQLVEVAAESGADLIKFQTFTAKNIATKDAVMAKYQNAANRLNESQFEMLERLELSQEMHKILVEHCQLHNIGFFSTGFNIEDIKFLNTLGMDRIKIPSGEITNLPYLKYVGALGLPLILSTGMASLGEIEDAINALESVGSKRELITVLHCNTEYPTPFCDVNLTAMVSISRAFGVEVGYSDHTQGIEVALSAVALGATVIEKHFTIDRTLSGPDHSASLEPTELKSMITSIRNIEMALGDGIKRPSKSEKKNRDATRRSLVANTEIKDGELFTTSNLVAKRPGSGISPMRWDEVVGKRARRNFAKDEIVTL